MNPLPHRIKSWNSDTNAVGTTWVSRSLLWERVQPAIDGRDWRNHRGQSPLPHRIKNWNSDTNAVGTTWVSLRASGFKLRTRRKT